MHNKKQQKNIKYIKYFFISGCLARIRSGLLILSISISKRSFVRFPIIAIRETIMIGGIICNKSIISSFTKAQIMLAIIIKMFNGRIPVSKSLIVDK